MRYQLSRKNKAFIYKTLKRVMEAIGCQGSARRQFLKLILKFTPGNDVLYISDAERHVLLAWLYRIKEASLVRQEEAVLKKVSEIIEALS